MAKSICTLKSELYKKGETHIIIIISIIISSSSIIITAIFIVNQAVLNEPGISITLNCTFKAPSNKNDDIVCIWYKQTLKKEPQQVGTAKINKMAMISSQFNNFRFIIKWINTTNSLTILNLTEEDEGTYFCGVAEKSEIITKLLWWRCMRHATLHCCRGGEGNSLSLITVMFTKLCCSFPQPHDAEELNYAAIHFSERKTKRGQENRGQPEDSVYSGVKRSDFTDCHLDY
uniref:Ig-like domain-containing protein n=1 Tax=Electrophorus electricus TaxID=8005 RepID=A0A4W4DYQ6_ELEEL